MRAEAATRNPIRRSETVEAGAKVLRSGGNAVDAAIAAGLVAGVVDPQMCGIAGFGNLQVSAPRVSGTSDAIDVSNGVPWSVSDALEAEGYQVIRSPRTHDFALVHGIRVDGGRLDGGADPAGDGTVQTV